MKHKLETSTKIQCKNEKKTQGMKIFLPFASLDVFKVSMKTI
jgi:hypothetical protein